MASSADGGKQLDGRQAAVLAVRDALGGERFASDTLRTLRATGRLPQREGGLATEIALGAVRHVITIEQVLGAVARFDRRRVTPLLRAILYTAAYQVIWMDRVPVFAAVDQAVGLARRLGRGRAGGMVNAILRRLSGAIAERRVGWTRLDPTQVRVSWEQACQFRTAVLPPVGAVATEAVHIAAATGERVERYEALIARYGAPVAEEVAWALQAVPVLVLQRNGLRATREAFEQQLRQVSGEAVEFAGEAAFMSAGAAVVDAPVFQDGLVYVQDGTAHAAAQAVGAQPGERILDLCAAPGGKSLALAVGMGDRGLVLACDVTQPRLGQVDANVARLGLASVQTRLVDQERAEWGRLDEAFDAALVDVPCSNSGVIARRPEARLGLAQAKLRSLVAVQQRLLASAAEWVRPGGRLVFSTCSIEPEENGEVVAAFLAAHPEWRRDAEQTTLPAWGGRLSAWRDGGYWARLVRSGREGAGSVG